MPVRHGGYLGQMGDAQHLVGMGHGVELLGHPPGRPAADARIDFIEDQGVDVVPAGQHGLDGQHDAGQLAAAGHLAQGPHALAGIGGNQELHIVVALCGDGLGPVYGDLEFHRGEVQVHQGLLQLLRQHGGMFPADLGKPAAALLQVCPGRGQAPVQPFDIGVVVLQLVQELLPPLPVGDHCLQGVPVFFLQAVQEVQPLLHGGILLVVELAVLHVLGQVPVVVRQQIVDLRQFPLQLSQAAVQPRHVAQGTQGAAQGASRSSLEVAAGVLIAF